MLAEDPGNVEGLCSFSGLEVLAEASGNVEGLCSSSGLEMLTETPGKDVPTRY